MFTVDGVQADVAKHAALDDYSARIISYKEGGIDVLPQLNFTNNAQLNVLLNSQKKKSKLVMFIALREHSQASQIAPKAGSGDCCGYCGPS